MHCSDMDAFSGIDALFGCLFHVRVSTQYPDVDTLFGCLGSARVLMQCSSIFECFVVYAMFGR